MKWALRIARIAGIRLYIHWTFLLLLGWVVVREVGRGSDTATVLLTLAYVLTIFGCVVLHELGHSLTARRYGIPTRRITLLPIGGVASLARMPEDPRQELLVAVAGPAVNVVIALLLLPFIDVGQAYTDEMTTAITPHNFLLSLFAVNIVLVLFNAIPAFPMDGGRVLRALLALKIGRTRATQIAARIGQFIAFAFAAYGFLGGNFLLIFIGIFVYFGAQGENLAVQHLEHLRDHVVRDAMMTDVAVLRSDDPIQKAVGQLLARTDQDFLVVNEEAQVLGIITRARLIEALQRGRTEATAAEVMEAPSEAFHPTDRMTQIWPRLQRERRTLFPVVEGGRLVGAINLENVNEFIMVQSALNHY
ncbi:Zn-dependent protease (includes SpoIVFB) [Catalinimonas alkaloidigena]|uniref:Zinc metalloprotease n=1 Tax=Catalinimonas alkaloidigena TaxID=1075417 RepID=A0A1G9K2U1_9BACT|nr:site-2 protease family protein [Catalinimonas alkaloidigena]SDL44137.1 Zn-dependent protease (includes SpoIVFB) [Catalinimonas alkaloidigena]